MLGSSVTWWRAHRVDVALVLLTLVLTAPMVQQMKAQQASRQALTAALWDDQSVRIDGYPIGVDRAERDGHVYSDKAPGQPVFAIPAYALYRAVGGEPATVLRPDRNLGLWVTSVWSSTLPTAALVLLLRRAVRRVDPRVATVVPVLALASTLLLPFGSVLFGHALATCLAFGGWLLVSDHPPSDRVLVGAGALLGAAVLTEYTMVLVVAAVGAHVVASCGTRAWRFAAGGLPALGLLLAYQWVAFGSPFAFSYASSSFGSASQELGLAPQDPALLDNAVRVLVGERGLLVVSPVLAIAAVGMAVLLRQRRGFERGAYLAAAASAALVVGVQMFWSNPTGGDSPGPRYATAAAAFLVPGLAVAWSRWRRWSVALAALGATVMLAATWTNPLEARDSQNAVGIWLGKLFRGEWGVTVYEMLLGRWAAVLLPVGVLAALALLVAVSPTRPPAGSPRTGAPSDALR